MIILQIVNALAILQEIGITLVYYVIISPREF